MAFVGRTERRLALAIVLTAVIPLIASIYFARTLIDRAFAQAFSPEVGEHLDRALGVYQDLVRATKESMRNEAEAVASYEPLRAAARLRHQPSLSQELEAMFARHPALVSISVVDASGTVLAERERAHDGGDEGTARLEVRRPLDEGNEAPELLTVFATPRARFDELLKMSEYVAAYHQVESASTKMKRGDLYAFAVILVLTILMAVALGTFLARSVTRRIELLAAATQDVARGNLAVRVVEQGNDELTDLSRAFNRMLQEVEVNRARIEFLQRMGAWQEMARRLAHEIKNPLTPILLAVQECHIKYQGADPHFRRLLDTTLEIVEEEVGTLRRLVTEFSAFARMPRAELKEADLGAFLRDQVGRAHLLEEADSLPLEPEHEGRVQILWNVPEQIMPVAIDRQMLRRVMVNVVQNALQAIVATGKRGEVRISVEQEHGNYSVFVDDDGPGVPELMRDRIFDPYVTTKAEGTGLGLAIVKKIVMEHGGTIEVGSSPLGGARFHIKVPRSTTAAARAARAVDGSVESSGVHADPSGA